MAHVLSPTVSRAEEEEEEKSKFSFPEEKRKKFEICDFVWGEESVISPPPRIWNISPLRRIEKKSGKWGGGAEDK